MKIKVILLGLMLLLLPCFAGATSVSYSASGNNAAPGTTYFGMSTATVSHLLGAASGRVISFKVSVPEPNAELLLGLGMLGLMGLATLTRKKIAV